MIEDKNIILYVMNLPPGTIEAVREYEKEFGRKLRIMLLMDSRLREVKGLAQTPGLDIYKTCDFSKPWKITETLLPYQNQIMAITCRSEKYLGRFCEVLPHVPYLRAPSTESLRWASDKYEMRKRLRLFDTKLTPKFTKVKKNSAEERERVVKMIGFPMIVKPANLAASLFVTICYHEEELEIALRTIFRKLKKAYKDSDRLESPTVIAESYMEGDMYSVDSYVNSRGVVYHCPLVRVTTGKNIGHDDFYNYLQMTPTALKSGTIARAEEAAEKSIHALGLRSTLAHVELMKMDDEWKIIEIGARMGGFRHLLHKLSCGINHALNDVLIRIPKRPHIPKKCQGYSCAMKWFAKKEGKITEMKGIKKIEELESFHMIDVSKKIGDRATFARNGGKSVFNLFMYNADRSKLLADIRRVEQLVHIKVASRNNKKK
ncbi:MAG: ATP-grasp domain-containing protein [Candidatus Pacebacteria bacterium]|nr:ATP-grasp domain-containing protein [Candidatus Paceibacterota bacterium]